jgi:hypothetical protein
MSHTTASILATAPQTALSAANPSRRQKPSRETAAFSPSNITSLFGCIVGMWANIPSQFSMLARSTWDAVVIEAGVMAV